MGANKCNQARCHLFQTSSKLKTDTSTLFAAAKRSSRLSSHEAACLDVAIPVIVHLLEHTLVTHSVSRLHGWEAAFWLLSLYVALHHGSAYCISCQLDMVVRAAQATCILWMFRTCKGMLQISHGVFSMQNNANWVAGANCKQVSSLHNRCQQTYPRIMCP